VKKVITILLLICICCFSPALFCAEEDSFEYLLDRVPVNAYAGESASTIESVGLMSGHFKCASYILLEELFRTGLIPKDVPEFGSLPSREQVLACPRVSVSDVFRTFDRLFGPGASQLLKNAERIGGDSSYIQLLDEENYAYVPYSYLGGMGSAYRICYVKSETAGDRVFVYARFAHYSAPGYPSIWISGWISGTPDGDFARYQLLDTVDTSDWSVQPWSRIDAGEFDEYFPIYKHTFVSNGDGTYYWDSTEMVESGKNIPLSVIASIPATESSDVSTATDTPGFSVSVPSTDLSTDGTPDSGAPAPAEEGSFPWIRICIGGAVIAVLVAAALLLKKKKA